MSKKEWISLWQQALGVDYKPQTDIRAIKSEQLKQSQRLQNIQ